MLFDSLQDIFQMNGVFPLPGIHFNNYFIRIKSIMPDMRLKHILIAGKCFCLTNNFISFVFRIIKTYHHLVFFSCRPVKTYHQQMKIDS